ALVAARDDFPMAFGRGGEVTDSRPTPPPGHLASKLVACDLLNIGMRELDALIQSGRVRTERIKGRLYVDLGDVERNAGQPLRIGGGAGVTPNARPWCRPWHATGSTPDQPAPIRGNRGVRRTMATGKACRSAEPM